MIELIKGSKKVSITIGTALIVFSISLVAAHASEKIFTIGVINDAPILSRSIDGFKAGMAESGYIEGKNIKYLFNPHLENNQKIIDAEIKLLLSQGVDLLLTIGNYTAKEAKKMVGGTDMPVLLCAVLNPVEDGLVKSLSHPGGNITGVVDTDSTSKTLELLKMMTPGLKKVYLPYNPDDAVTIVCLSGLDQAAKHLGIELVYLKVHSVEEAVAALRALPKGGNAILRVPSPTLDNRNRELSQAAIKRGLPMGSRVPLDEAVLMTYSDDLFDMGKKAARLAQLIHQGAKPADLPVETSEVFLTINLRTAEKIGLHIPDEILVRANNIIR